MLFQIKQNIVNAGRGLYYARVKHLKRRQKELALSVGEQARELQKEIAERRRAEAQLERNLRETRLRYEVSQALAGAETEDEVLDVLIQQAGFYPEAFVSIFTFDRRGGEPTAIVRRQGIFESGLKAVVPIGGSLPASRYPLYHHFSADKPFVSEDVLADERVDAAEREIFRQTGAASLTVIPLTAENEWMGFIGVTAKHTGYFDEEKQRLYQTLAEQGAVALRAARLREAIRESQQRFQALVETMSDWIWEVDQNGLFTYVSPRITDLLGYEPVELLGKRPFDFMQPEEAGRVRSVFDQLFGNRQPVVNVENTLLHKDGRLVVFETSAAPFFNPGGEFKGYRGVNRDITERRRAEETLHDSEWKLKEAQRLGHIGHWEFDVETRQIQWSDMVFELYERDPSLGPPTEEGEAEYYSIEDSERLRSYAQQTIKTGKPYQIDVRLRLPGGRVKEVVATGAPVKDPHGRVTKLLGTVQDITERKHAEEALRYERNLLRTLIDNLPDLIYVKDSACRKTIANTADVRYMGCQSEAEVLGKNDFDCYPAEIAAKFFADDQSVLQTGQPVVNREEYVLDEQGQKRWLLTSKFPLQDEKGQAIGLVGIGRDITAHKRAEEALQQERNLLRTVIDNLPDGIYVKDTACRKIVINQADLRVLRCASEAEALGKTDFEFFPRDVAEKFYADDLAVIQTGQPVINREEYFFDTEGQKRWLLTSKLPFRDQNGQIIGLVGIGRDITNRVQAEEALRESRQMLQTVLDTIPARVFWKDRESRYLGCNRSFAKDAGFSKPDELIGKDDFQFSWREEAPLYRDDDHQVITTGLPKLNYEERQTVADGHCAWVRTSKIPLRDAKGEITGVLGTYEDITERKQAEEQLRLLAHAVESTTELISITDLENRFTFVNKAFLDAYGYSEEEILGKHFSILRSPMNPPHLGEEISVNTMRGGWTGELLNRRKDGSDFPVSLSTSIIRGKEGQALGLLGVARDISEHKKAEDALAAERNLLRTIMDNLPDRVYIKDTECRFLINNLAHTKALGVKTPEEAVGKTDFDFRPSNMAAQSYADDQEVIHSGQPLHNREEETILPTGSRGWLLSTKVPLRDQEGKVIGLVGISRDISERKRAQDALEQSRAWFAALFDASRDGIVVERDETIVFANKAFSELHGYKQPEELVGRPVVVVQAPEEVERLLEYGRRRVIGEPAPSLYEYRARRKDGSTIELENSVSVAEIAGDKYVISVVRDIRERKRTEEAIVKLSSAVEQGVDGIVITTKEGIIEYVNPAWESMTGYTKEEAIGSTPRILKSGKEKDALYQTLWKTILGGQVWRGSLINKKKSGELFDAEVSIAPIFGNEHRSITHFVAIERDVTDYKRLEQQLIQALKMEGLGTLAGGVAHDFNNILGIILGHTSLLEGRKADPAKFSRSVAAISTAAQRGASLVRQLLTVARKTDSLLETVNVNETIEELFRMLKETFPRTIEFSLQLGKDVPTIAADRNQLYQALLNLCINSRDAMPNGGTLTISTESILGTRLQSKHADAHGEKYVCIAVIDSGIGMDQKTRSRIFEPFFTTKERGRGTGLGLSVVYGVINSHNGFIDVESEPGHGTTFRLYLPVIPPEIRTSMREPKEEGDIPGGKETVLIVEDEEALLEPLKQALEGKGYHILAAKDGIEALEVYRRHKHNVAAVVIDMGLPKLGGWEVFQKLRSMNPTVKVILASGYLDPQSKSEILKAGAKDFIQKPYVPEQILRRIRRVIDSK